ncbi:uncharacterized protein LOC124372553 [Homalodisca vitripennis]|uniref:uncharacterized protein LOC124372553 n=1 Tax=Homalodisca vitripennis TaxID=197043 RepID=UPI001EEAE21D|nr:uncharacterized protein LOC124372553 [Homalodisca vitripennis]
MVADCFNEYFTSIAGETLKAKHFTEKLPYLFSSSNQLRIMDWSRFIQQLLMRSTITAVADIVEHILDSLEAGNTVCAAFLDLSKAFDCLDHQLILEKLRTFGIVGSALAWFGSYLSDRQQLVEIKHTVKGTTSVVRSELLGVSRGVPQGPPQIHDTYSHTVMFADDSVLLTSNRELEPLEISNFISISKAMEYCANNDLVFNENKTQQVFFGKFKNDITCPPDIQVTESTKHLGIILDQELCWGAHIDYLCQRLSSSIFALRRINSVGTVDATRAAYHALVESQLRYGIIFWGNCSKEKHPASFCSSKACC